jgi:pilus assembly protein CpaC
LSATSFRSTSKRLRTAGAAVALLAAGWLAAPRGAPAAETDAKPPVAGILLAPGQIQTVSVSEVQRIAVGDPEVADVTIISPTEILIQAKRAGTTNLILWDARGQQQATISVVDPRPDAVARELTEMLASRNLLNVKVKVQDNKVFLLGEVGTKEELNNLETITSAFPQTVVNVVTVRTIPPPPPAPAPMVKLSVQVIDINRSDLEQLGIKWSEGFTVGQPEAEDLTLRESLTKFGTGLTRTSISATLSALVQRNKARVLSEPKLVTASGREASSFIGVEVPVLQATAVGTDSTSVNASIDFRETGVLLRMTPNVLPAEQDRKITTVLEAEVSGVDTSVGLSVPVGSRTITVPGFKVRKANTEVTTASGETIIIAGLLEAEDTDTMSQVPGLGGMPVIGRLFRSPELKSTQRELVITVTPELLHDEADTVDRQMALEQALAVAEVTASVDDPRLRYALQIQERIASALRYPQREKELNIDGTVKLKLHLFADGSLGRAAVSQSSGVETLDMEALKAAETQAPYPGFPSQLVEKELWLEVPVIFRP